MLGVYFESGVVLGRREAEIIILCLKLQADENDPLRGENLMYEIGENCWNNFLNRKRGWELVLGLPGPFFFLSVRGFLLPFLLPDYCFGHSVAEWMSSVSENKSVQILNLEFSQLYIVDLK